MSCIGSARKLSGSTTTASSLCLVVLALLHNTGTYRRHARTETRTDDGSHQMTAECRTGHLQVRVVHLELAAASTLMVDDSLKNCTYLSMSISRWVQSAVRPVCSRAATARAKITADVGSADQQYSPASSPSPHYRSPSLYASVVYTSSSRIFAHDHFICTITAQFFRNGLLAPLPPSRMPHQLGTHAHQPAFVPSLISSKSVFISLPSRCSQNTHISRNSLISALL